MRHWAKEGTPADFGHELLPDDLSCMEWNFEKSVEIMPCLAEAGVKRVINGPMIFSPDLSPLDRPAPGLAQLFLRQWCDGRVQSGCGHRAGDLGMDHRVASPRLTSSTGMWRGLAIGRTGNIPKR